MKLAALLLIVSMLSAGCISKELRAIDESPDRSTTVVAIANRGASAYAPENTFAAFDKAQELGAIAATVDVQLTKDQKVVVFHDASLEEKAALRGPVNAHTWDELSKVDLAPWFAKQAATTTGDVKEDAAETPKRVATVGTAAPNSSKKANAGGVKKSSKRSSSRQTRVAQPTNSLTHIILLDDLFERYGMTFAYNVHLASKDEKLPELAYKSMREYGLRDNVTFTSFDADQLSKIRTMDKDVALCLLIDDQKTVDVFGEIMRAKTLGFNAVSVRASYVNAEQVKRAKQAGIKIYSWGVTNDADAQNAVNAGVSAVATNWPDRLLKLVQNPVFR